MQNSQQSSKAEHWKGLVNEWASSGKSMRKWCLENAIPVNTFRYWKNKFSFCELDKKAFTEILEEQSTGIVIRCKNLEIHLDKEFDQQTLLRCLTVMGRGLC